jgi:hypothetical protein
MGPGKPATCKEVWTQGEVDVPTRHDEAETRAYGTPSIREIREQTMHGRERHRGRGNVPSSKKPADEVDITLYLRAFAVYVPCYKDLSSLN